MSAAHDSYTHLPEYEEATRSGTIDTQIAVPPLGERTALELVLTHRVWIHTGCSDLAEVFDDGARDELWRAYREEADERIRDLLQVVQGALVDADVSGLDRLIGLEQVRASIADALGR